MNGPREKNRRQDMYKQRGRRPHANNPNNRMGWYKAMIKDGVNYGRQEVLDGIRSLVHEPFIPVLCEVEGKSLVFYLEDNGPAVQAISEISRRLTMSTGEKLTIFFNRSPPPNRPLTQPQREQVMQVMSGRYSPEMKRLDLKNFHNDSTLVKENIFCPLYRQPNMQIVVNIIMEHIPHVEEIDLSHNKMTCLDELERLKSSCTNLHRLSLKKNKLASPDSLDKLSGMQITDLTLEDNPLCDRFRDTESYISAVRKRFPKVLYLDSQELPKPIGFDVDEEVTKIPKSIPTYFVEPNAQNLVTVFLQEYYKIFDSTDRLKLQEAYSQHALLSLSCNFPESGPGARFTSLYNAENRNLKKITNNERRYKLVVQGRNNIGKFLSSLPQTNHDLMSFEVDVPLAEATLMVVVVSGVYSQIADRNPPIRSFKRTMIIIPEGSGYCITNEQLYLTNATVDQVKKAFKEPPAKDPQPVPVPNVEVQQKEAMALKFSEASGMLPCYSLQCLEENEWDFEKAAAVFTKLKAENKIPPEYFPPSQP